MSRLALPPAEADKVSDSVASLLEHAPSTVPALDIEIDDFELRGHKLGSLAVEAVNRTLGGAGEWRWFAVRAGALSFDFLDARDVAAAFERRG